MDTIDRIKRYGDEREAALDLAEDRLTRCVELVPEARAEGVSMSKIAEAACISRQQLYTRLKEEE